MLKTAKKAVSQEVVDFLLDQTETPLRFRAMELILLKEYLRCGGNGAVIIKQPRLMELTGVSAPTARAFTAEMIRSGRWKVQIGVGGLLTTYEALFLSQFPTAVRKGN